MKMKTTKKAIVETSKNIRYVKYRDLQFLLWDHKPIAYTVGNNGWNFNVYNVCGLTICVGCEDMPGIPLHHVKAYEKRAERFVAAVHNNMITRYEYEKAMEKVLKDFCNVNI